METPSLNSPSPQLNANSSSHESGLMLKAENNPADAVLSAVKAWEAESRRLHSDVSTVF